MWLCSMHPTISYLCLNPVKPVLLPLYQQSIVSWPLYYGITVCRTCLCSFLLTILRPMVFPIKVVRMVHLIYRGATDYNLKINDFIFPLVIFCPSKQCRSWWNASLCSISFESSLFVVVPVQGFPVFKWLKVIFFFLQHPFLWSVCCWWKFEIFTTFSPGSVRLKSWNYSITSKIQTSIIRNTRWCEINLGYTEFREIGPIQDQYK